VRKAAWLGAVVLAVGMVPATSALAASGGNAATPKVTQHPTHHACARSTHKNVAACGAIVRDDVAQPHVSPLATPSGYGPADLQSAYKLNTSGGSGLTVAIVDAYDLPTAASDLSTYRTQYGLPSCTTSNGCFRKVNQTGGSTPPASDPGWGQEIALDLDMVSSACPNCHILLVEANSASMTDLGTAVNEAVTLGANAVSNSYGGSESSSDTSYDSSYFNHPGVAITVSSGDSGYGPEYPAASRYVTAVGGTSLTTASNSRGWSETAWSGAGSGCSAYDSIPSWQNSTTTGCSRRAEADVSSVADPNTGVAVYDSTPNGGQSGWMVFGGTSASSPFIAGVYMLAGTPVAGTYPAQYPWSHTGNLFDVTSGSNGSCSPSQLCTARTGWDGPTGWGTPNGSAAFASGGGGGGGCTAGQLLGNPGFETGSAAPWSATAGVINPNGAGETSHSGTYYAWLDGYGTTHTDTLSQSVTLPSGCTSYTLSFWLHIDTAETTTSVAYDTLKVQVIGSTTTTYATYSNLDHNTGYTQHSFNIGSYAGQTVTVKFTGTEDVSLQTSFVIDDTAVNVS
jgi:subtilase family serine protease